MMINRNNYEEFFLLYLDGELETTDRLAVEEFLAANPDLAVEMGQLKTTILEIDVNEQFEHPELLLKPVPGDVINELNKETYFLSYIDNELNAADKAATEKFMLENPVSLQELELLRQAKLSPDTTIVFSDKSVLYREEKSRKIVYFSWVRIGVAAAVMGLLASVWFSRTQTKSDPASGFATVTNTDSRAAKQNSATSPGNNTQPAALAATEETKQPEKNITVIKPQPGSNKPEQQHEAYTTLPSDNKEKTILPYDNAPRAVTPTDPGDLALQTIKPVQQIEAEKGSLQTINTHQQVSAGSQNALRISLAANESLSDNDDDILIGNTRINRSAFRGIIRKTGRLLERSANIGEEKTAALFKRDKNNKKDN